jgi:hypothetical protein
LSISGIRLSDGFHRRLSRAGPWEGVERENAELAEAVRPREVAAASRAHLAATHQEVPHAIVDEAIQ